MPTAAPGMAVLDACREARKSTPLICDPGRLVDMGKPRRAPRGGVARALAGPDQRLLAALAFDQRSVDRAWEAGVVELEGEVVTTFA